MRKFVPSQLVGFIDQFFPWAVQKPSRPVLGTRSAPALAIIIKHVEELSEDFLPLDEKRYGEFLCCIAALHQALGQLNAGDAIVLADLPQLPSTNPLSLLREMLINCPDEAIPTSTSELTFISDAELRDTLRRDIAATERALINGEWKASTVLAGSVVEALLLWALAQRGAAPFNAAKTLVSNKLLDDYPGKDLERWRLIDYIAVARQLAIIKDDTAKQADLAKDYRNLIHPGRSIRLGMLCDRGTAFSAIAAVLCVIRDLQR